MRFRILSSCVFLSLLASCADIAPEDLVTDEVAEALRATGSYSLIQEGSGKCLASAGARAQAGTTAALEGCDHSPRVSYRLRPHGAGYRIQNVASGLCLDVRGATKSEGAPVIEWPCHDGTNQQWTLQKAAGGKYNLVALHSGLYLQGQVDASGAGNAVQKKKKSGAKEQLWSLELGADTPFRATLQFENGKTVGDATTTLHPTERNLPHGTGYASFVQDGTITVEVEVPASQNYAVTLRHRATPGKGNKYGNILDFGPYTVPFDSMKGQVWQETAFARRHLTKGKHKLRVSRGGGGWGYVDADEVTITAMPAEPRPVVRRDPVDPDAKPEARRLLAFLANQAGKHVLAGQHDIAWSEDPAWDMLSMVKRETGKTPALMGYDFMHMRWGRKYPGGNQDREAIAFAQQGGIVTVTWHWMPGSEWGLYAGETPFRINRDPNSAEYKTIVADIEKVAGWLMNLQNAGVPVLFRPLHEATGGGFWWGASGPEEYNWLYRFMWDRLVNHHGLHNLLWVWNGGVGSVPKDWYPGDDVVDIGAVDYGNSWAEPRLDLYEELNQTVRGGASLTAWSEASYFPDPDVLLRDGAWWSYVAHWYDDGNGPAWSGDANRVRFYQHPYVMTLESLPDLTTYPY